jgi:CubicO group peptidase (beta-lactamase class C family)
MRRILVAVIACLCCALVEAQMPSLHRARELTDAIAKTMLASPVAGISIAVARDDRVVLARGYGLATWNIRFPVTPETVFHIASISRTYWPRFVLQLVDEGKLRLADDVTSMCRRRRRHGQHVHRTATPQSHVRHLQLHVAPRTADNERFDLTHQQVLELIKDKPVDFEPGTSWRLQQFSFYLAGMLVSGSPVQEYGAYLRGRIFQPLTMDSASGV